MNEEKLRSDWDALTEEEKEEVIEAFKSAIEAIKRATVVFAEMATKVIPELLKSDTDCLTGFKDNEEGVL